MDYDKIEAGRELDSRIAQEVMQLTVVGWGTAGHCEGEWMVQLGESLENRGIYVEHAPLFLDHCVCDIMKLEPRPVGLYGETLNGHYNGCLDVVPYYSKEWDAAGEVVEKLRSDHFQWCCIDLHSNFHYQWTCGLIRYKQNDDTEEGHKYDVIGRADTAPLAICRAALKAVDSLKVEGEG